MRAWLDGGTDYSARVAAFLPSPDPMPTPASGAGHWRRVLLASAALAAIATTQPWVQVQFDRLFGSHSGPPGWQSSAGFMCLCSCALVSIMAIAETSSEVTQQAARPASLLLVAISVVSLAFEWWSGPGQLRGVSASWTFAFWLVICSLPALLAVCLARCGALAARPTRDRS